MQGIVDISNDVCHGEASTLEEDMEPIAELIINYLSASKDCDDATGNILETTERYRDTMYTLNECGFDVINGKGCGKAILQLEESLRAKRIANNLSTQYRKVVVGLACVEAEEAMEALRYYGVDTKKLGDLYN